MSDAVTMVPTTRVGSNDGCFGELLSYQGRSMRTVFPGSIPVAGGASRAPNLYEVMQRLLNDAAAVERTSDFPGWAETVGLDSARVTEYLCGQFGMGLSPRTEVEGRSLDLRLSGVDRRALNRFVVASERLEGISWDERARMSAVAVHRVKSWTRRRYAATIQQTAQLRTLLGGDYEEFLWGASAGWEAHQGPGPGGLGANNRGLLSRDQLPAGAARLQEMAEGLGWDDPLH
jgi:hypothetical protein